MRALRKTARGPGAELVEIPVPEPREGEVLVKVHGASICGTDLHIYDWNEWADKRIPQVPMTFGHEVAGTVVGVGEEVHHLQEGVFVAAETHIACGHCPTCQTGRAHICENLRILGVDIDGVFAEYVVVPAPERVDRRGGDRSRTSRRSWSRSATRCTPRSARAVARTSPPTRWR